MQHNTLHTCNIKGHRSDLKFNIFFSVQCILYLNKAEYFLPVYRVYASELSGITLTSPQRVYLWLMVFFLPAFRVYRSENQTYFHQCIVSIHANMNTYQCTKWINLKKKWPFPFPLPYGRIPNSAESINIRKKVGLFPKVSSLIQELQYFYQCAVCTVRNKAGCCLGRGFISTRLLYPAALGQIFYVSLESERERDNPDPKGWGACLGVPRGVSRSRSKGGRGEGG